jgi:hypothetical protein
MLGLQTVRQKKKLKKSLNFSTTVLQRAWLTLNTQLEKKKKKRKKVRVHVVKRLSSKWVWKDAWRREGEAGTEFDRKAGLLGASGAKRVRRQRESRKVEIKRQRSPIYCPSE